MATVSGRTNLTLSEKIRLNASAFNLDQLIKLLLMQEDNGQGEICDKIDDGLFRVQSHIRYDMPPTDISGIASITKKSDPHGIPINRLLLNHFGIVSFNSPMPLPYVEWIFRELHNGLRNEKYSSILDFIDIFNHRFLSIRHQNRAEQRVSLSSDHPNRSVVARRIESLAGFDDQRLFDLVKIGLYNRQEQVEAEGEKEVEHHLIQTFSGLIYNPRKSADYIKTVLSTVFNAPVTLEQFLGQWLGLEDEDLNSLGKANHSLGDQLILGKTCWDQQSLIGIRIGPVCFKTLVDMVKGGVLHSSLVSLIGFLSDGDWDCEVGILIRNEDIPKSVLQGKVSRFSLKPPMNMRDWLRRPKIKISPDRYMQLGRESWLKTETAVNKLIPVSRPDGLTEFRVDI